MSLETDLAGLSLRNPLIVAASPVSETVDGIVACNRYGAGAIITKSIGDYRDRYPSTAGRRIYLEQAIGMWMLSSWEREVMPLERGTQLISEATTLTDIPIIASAVAREMAAKPWLQLCTSLQKAGAHMIQLDLYYFPRPFYHWSNRSKLRGILELLSEKLSIPLLVKLNTDIDPDLIVDIVQGTNVAGFSLLDSVRVANPISVEEGGKPKYQFVGKVGNCSIAGPWLKPLSLLYTHRLSSVTSLPIITGGGLVDARDAIEAIMYGATAVQFAFAILLHGFGRIQKVVAELEQFIKEHGWISLKSIIGLAKTYIDPKGETEISPALASIDVEACDRCGECLAITLCQAIEADNQITVRPQLCDGCGLCTFVCRKHAITLRRR